MAENLKSTVLAETVATGKVTGLALYGVFIVLDGSGVRGLLPVSQMAGETNAQREARLKDITIGDTIETLVTKVETVGEGKKSRLKVTLSERALAARKAREERQARDERVIAELAPGTAVDGVVAEVRIGLGAFVTICGEGVASGMRALVHVSELTEGTREERDAALARLKAGDSLSTEVIKVGRNDRGILEIGLSARAVVRQKNEAKAAGLIEKGSVTTLSVVRSSADGLVLQLSGGVTAILPDGKLNGTRRASIMKTKRVKVRIVGVDGKGRLVAEKA